jgi:hypothetical protein
LGNGAGDTVNAQSGDSYGITLGNGARDTVNAQDSHSEGNGHSYSVTLGDGAGDTVNAQLSLGVNVTLGNGAHDVVSAQNSLGDSIAVGNGDDTIYAGQNTTITVGTGRDSFVFEQTTPGTIGQATITGFDPHKDVITFSNQLTSSVSYHDNAQGNAVVTVDNAGDTITLVGVHASELHPSDFHFVDPAALAAVPSPAQHLADVHAHSFLL